MHEKILSEWHALVQLAWPIVVGQMATVGIGAIDVALTGHASSTDQAGVALAAAIFNTILVTQIGILLAVNANVAHRVGAIRVGLAEPGEIAVLMRQALWMGTLVGVCGIFICLLCALLLPALPGEAATITIAQHFLFWASPGLLPFCLYRVLYGYSAGLGHTRPMMWVSLAALIFNGVLAWMLTFGIAGLPRMGGAGCGLAALLSLCFSYSMMGWWVRRAAIYRASWDLPAAPMLAGIRPTWVGPDWQLIRPMLMLGLSIGVASFVETTAFTLIVLLLARFGAETVAAHQIAIQLVIVLFMIPLGFSVAMISRVGEALGAGTSEVARSRTLACLLLVLGYALLAASFILLARAPIAARFTQDTAVIAQASHLLIFSALFQIPDCLQVCANYALRAYRRTRAAMVIQITAFWGISLPLGCVLGLGWGGDWLGHRPQAAQGFWIGLDIGLTVAAIGLLTLLAHTLHRKREKFS